jgi:hypothetical protein
MRMDHTDVKREACDVRDRRGSSAQMRAGQESARSGHHAVASIWCPGSAEASSGHSTHAVRALSAAL